MLFTSIKKNNITWMTKVKNQVVKVSPGGSLTGGRGLTPWGQGLTTWG